jgi:hypothetical protein
MTKIGKGDTYRPHTTTREEQDLRRRYATTRMTFKEFEAAYKKLMRQGKIKRSGRVIRDA